MAISIKPKRKFTTGTPTTTDIVEGEIAVNTADQKIWMRDNASNIVQVGGVGGSVTISETAPGTPSSGDLWWDSTDDDANLKIYYTDGTPTSQWVTATVAGGQVSGADTQIQFNDSGQFGASASFTWDGTSVSATNIKISDGGDIGSSSDPDAISISAGGVVTFSQTPVFSSGIGTITSGTLSTGAVLADVTVTIGSDADGDVYYRSSNKLARLAKGTAGQVLTMNGGATAPSWAAGGASSLNDLSDVVFDTTNFTNSLMLGETPTGTLSSANYNTFVGFLTGRPVTSGTYNAALGKGCLFALSSGDNNVAMGQEALSTVSTNNENTAIGKHSMRATNGTYNTGLGADSGYRHSGDGATYIGHSAGLQMYTGDYNTYVGYKAGYGGALWTATGDYNIALGVQALEGVTSGTGNIAVGYQAGDNITSANNNTIIGYNLDPDSATAGGEVVIGTNTRRIHIDSSGGVQFNSAYRFPVADGNAGQHLQTAGNGTVTWETPSGGGGITTGKAIAMAMVFG